MTAITAAAAAKARQTVDWLKAFRAGLANSTPTSKADLHRVAALAAAATLIITVVENQLSTPAHIAASPQSTSTGNH